MLIINVRGASPFKLMRVLCSKFGWTTDGEVFNVHTFHRGGLSSCYL